MSKMNKLSFISFLVMVLVVEVEIVKLWSFKWCVKREILVMLYDYDKLINVNVVLDI